MEQTSINQVSLNQASLKQTTEFLKKSYNRAVFPCMLTILSANINVFVDGILVGNRIGHEALAAINLSLPLFLFMCVIGSFFTSGTAILASNEIGKNRTDNALALYRTCVIVLLAISIIFTALGLIFTNDLVDFLCTDKSIQSLVRDYVVITIIGALPKIMIYIPLWYLRLDGRNISVMVMMGVLSIGNVILDILLVYILNMGVFGAGLASVIATTIALVIGMICLLSKKSTFTFKTRIITDKNIWKSIAVAGTPSAFNNLASTIRILMINSFLMSIGGEILVAVFGAVNGIYGVGEAIVLGIPQAGSPMLGVYSGEKDNNSSKLLLNIEIVTGLVYSAIFALVVLALSAPIRNMYNLEYQMFIPLFFMVLSVFFALFGSVLQGFYNVSGRNSWANALIFLRVLAMPFLGLMLVKNTGISTFSFLLIGEAGAMLVWFIAASIMNRRHPDYVKYFFMDNSMEKSGKVLNFSVEDDNSSICDASERISEFCSMNGLSMKNTMALQLSVEELLTLISTVNKNNSGKEHILYDLRAYSVDGIQGIRIRYNGIEFNPFDENKTDDDIFMGTQMIKRLVETYDFTRTFGVNTLIILLKEQ